MTAKTCFDFVVCGAGSAGCTLARRLAEKFPQKTVALLETGPKDFLPAIHAPFGVGMMPWLPFNRFRLFTDPEPNLKNRQLYWPRGRVMGGSSAINAMIYVRGHPDDYERWASEYGCSDWSWRRALEYFKRSEHQTASDLAEQEYHGTSGPLYVSDLLYVHGATKDFVKAGTEAGHPQRRDFNDPESMHGVGLYQVTQYKGKRWSTATAFLSEAKRRELTNLTILSSSAVERVLVNEEKGRAVGVKTQGSEIRARSQVYLCAGAIHSPHLLLQSGIGPEDTLKAAGLPQVLLHEGVGRNLQDHLDVTISMRTKTADAMALDIRSLPGQSLDLLRYALRGDGPMTSNVAEGACFLDSGVPKRKLRGKETTAPDLQMHFCSAIVKDHGRFPPYPKGYSLHVCDLHPESRGEVYVDSKKQLRIRANYLSAEKDKQRLVNGVRKAIDILRSASLARHQSEIYSPKGLTLDEFSAFSDEEMLSQIVEKFAETIYHPVGTCRMGVEDDRLAVVDSQFRVKGIEGLSVVDASVFPELPSGNTNAPTIMLAEVAADIVAMNCD